MLVANECHQAAGDLNKDFIAGSVPPVIVNEFEIIAVKKQQRRTMTCRVIVHQLTDDVAKRRAIRQSR